MVGILARIGLARRFSKVFRAPLIASSTSRLLVDLNRSEHHRALYSQITRTLPRDERERILDEHYRPYRDEVFAGVDRLIGMGKHVVHISSHSFVPELDGEVRNADIGLLYDPRRAREAALCDAWATTLKRSAAGHTGSAQLPLSRQRGWADERVAPQISCPSLRRHRGRIESARAR